MKIGFWIVYIVNTFSSINGTNICKGSSNQLCRMMCPEFTCPDGQCAMRNGNCCGYNCIDINSCPETCPVFQCPMPDIREMNNCRSVDPEIDNCGCPTGCPITNCEPNVVSEGNSCGGFVPYGMQSICDNGLECVNTMGPMVADAPGTCLPICNTIRDNWGNCVDEGCEHWHDGCNQCNIENNNLQCTERMCYVPDNAHCIDGNPNIINSIPKNCLTWYDGCNTCSISRGMLQGCTLMMCFTQNEPYCQAFTTEPLKVGDICYRFCEDGSQNTIDRRDECPVNLECASSNPSISFDTCGSRAYTCINGH